MSPSCLCKRLSTYICACLCTGLCTCLYTCQCTRHVHMHAYTLVNHRVYGQRIYVSMHMFCACPYPFLCRSPFPYTCRSLLVQKNGGALYMNTGIDVAIRDSTFANNIAERLVSMHACAVYADVYADAYTHAFTHIQMPMSTHMFLHTSIPMTAVLCMHMVICTCGHACIHVFAHVYTRVCTHVCDCLFLTCIFHSQLNLSHSVLG